MQRLHAGAPFLFFEIECSRDNLSSSFLVERIDQQRLARFRCRASKLAQQKHAIALTITGHIFFGNQIHTVAQRANPT